MTVDQGPDNFGPRRSGRRRDPKIDELAMDAALKVYVLKGWDGFTFEAIAREAGVGKPALYRRWNSPAHLLIDAFGQLDLPTPRNCGSLRADLLDYGNQFVAWYSMRERAFINLRLTVDRYRDTTLAALYDQYVRRPRIAAARAMTDLAIERGELDSALDARTAIELLIGAMNSHFTQTRQERLTRLIDTFPEYVETLVDIIIEGITARSQKRKVDAATGS